MLKTFYGKRFTSKQTEPKFVKVVFYKDDFWLIFLKSNLKVVVTKDDFHVFKKTILEIFGKKLSLEKTILRNIKILLEIVFSKDDF
jgi:hypothetical protein